VSQAEAFLHVGVQRRRRHNGVEGTEIKVDERVKNRHGGVASSRRTRVLSSTMRRSAASLAQTIFSHGLHAARSASKVARSGLGPDWRRSAQLDGPGSSIGPRTRLT
jgi:hypothetical protein